MELLVVGSGEMGRWLARTVDARVAFADADPDAAARAADAVGGRAVPLDADERFEVVCLAVPISAVTDAVARHAPGAERALFDVSGVMTAPIEAMRTHAQDLERMSLHPLFSSANAPGHVAVTVDASGPITDCVRADLEAAGNRCFDTTPTEHDRAMETVQASAHAAILAYALASESVREEFATPISADLEALARNVTGGTPRVYREIQETFDGAERVAEAARRLAGVEGEEFDALYRRAGRRFEDHDDREDANDRSPRGRG